MAAPRGVELDEGVAFTHHLTECGTAENVKTVLHHWLSRCRCCWLLLRNLIPKLVSYELLKRSSISVPSVLDTIILLSTALEEFKCWVSGDILGRAERGGHRAVHLGDGDLTVHVLVVLGRQLLPDRSKSLTVTTPWGKEHHEVRRATNKTLEVVFVQVSSSDSFISTSKTVAQQAGQQEVEQHSEAAHVLPTFSCRSESSNIS